VFEAREGGEGCGTGEGFEVEERPLGGSEGDVLGEGGEGVEARFVVIIAD